MTVTLGEKIRNLREEQNLTQAKLGKELNMTQRKISYIENDRYEPSLDDIKAICSFFQISADFLLDLPNHLLYP